MWTLPLCYFFLSYRYTFVLCFNSNAMQLKMICNSNYSRLKLYATLFYILFNVYNINNFYYFITLNDYWDEFKCNHNNDNYIKCNGYHCLLSVMISLCDQSIIIYKWERMIAFIRPWMDESKFWHNIQHHKYSESIEYKLLQVWEHLAEQDASYAVSYMLK